MARVSSSDRRLSLDTTGRLVAGTLSAGAALVSILTFLLNRQDAVAAAAMGPESAAALNAQVERITVSPLADTAYSLGDTIQLTAHAADARGLALVPGRVQWLAEDSAVAAVDSSGLVIARRPGVTSVTVAAGGRVGRARVWILPRVERLDIEGDSIIEVAEGEQLRLTLAARDARGNRIGAADLAWTVADREIAVVDSMGRLNGLTPGRTLVSAAAAGLLAQRQVTVRPVPASITLSAGARQRAPAGTPLASPVAVQVVSRSGFPVPAATVRFLAPGGGRVEPESTLTDAHGKASAAWSLGSVPGRQRLAVEVPGVDSPLVVTAEADPLPGRTRIQTLSDSLSGVVGAQLEQELTVQVSDTSGVVLADVPVAWTAADGGQVTATESRTDSLGRARARWTLGPRAGRQRARIQAGNPRTIPIVELAATAAPAPAVRIATVSGDKQRGPAGSPLARPLVLQVSDSFGNPVPGVAVRIAPESGSAADSALKSDARGRISVRWTLPPRAGPAQLTAQLARRDTVKLTATALPGAPASITLSGAPKTGTAGKPLAKPVTIAVTDRHGNPVPGVTLAASISTGKLSRTRPVTDEQGSATVAWTLGARAGRQTLTVRSLKGSLSASHAVTAQAAPARAPAKPRTAAPPRRPAPAPASAPVPSSRSPLGTAVP